MVIAAMDSSALFHASVMVCRRAHLHQDEGLNKGKGGAGFRIKVRGGLRFSCRAEDSLRLVPTSGCSNACPKFQVCAALWLIGYAAGTAGSYTDTMTSTASKGSALEPELAIL